MEERHSQTHILKSYPEYFQATIEKMKTHEIRHDPDGNFAVNDIIVLQEFDPVAQNYTGRKVALVITYISPGPESWIVPGYSVMSTRLADDNEYYAPAPDLTK